MDKREHKELRQACGHVNRELSDLSKVYHEHLPIREIDDILVLYGFNPTEPAIYCGADGQTHESVGHGKFLSWHRMESGRFEVIAYLN